MSRLSQRLPEPPVATANGDPTFTLTFTKADADALLACLDVTLKASGLPAAQSVTLWATKLRDAMQPPA